MSSTATTNRFVGVTCAERESGPKQKGQHNLVCTSSHTIAVYRGALSTQCLRQWATHPNKARPFSSPCVIHPYTQAYLCAQGATLLCWDEGVSQLGSSDCARLALDQPCAFLIVNLKLGKNVVLVQQNGTLHTAAVDKKHQFQNSRSLLKKRGGSIGDDETLTVFASDICEPVPGALPSRSQLMYTICRNETTGVYQLRLVSLETKKSGNLRAKIVLEFALFQRPKTKVVSSLGETSLTLPSSSSSKAALGATTSARLVDVCYHPELQSLSVLWDDCTWQTISFALLLAKGRAARGTTADAGTKSLVTVHSFQLPWMMSRAQQDAAQAAGLVDEYDNEELDFETAAGTDSAGVVAGVPPRKRGRGRSSSGALLQKRQIVRHVVAIGASRVLFVCDSLSSPPKKSGSQSSGLSQARASNVLIVPSNSTGPRLRLYDVRHGVPLATSGQDTTNNSVVGSHSPDFIELVQAVRFSSLRPQSGFVLLPGGTKTTTGGKSKNRKVRPGDSSRLLVYCGGRPSRGRGNLSMVQILDSVTTMATLLGSLQHASRPASALPITNGAAGSATSSSEQESQPQSLPFVPPTSTTLNVTDESGAVVMTLRGNDDVAAAVEAIGLMEDAQSYCTFVSSQLTKMEKKNKRKARSGSDAIVNSSASRRQSSSGRRGNSIADNNLADHGSSGLKTATAFSEKKVLQFREFILAAVNWCCTLHPELLAAPANNSNTTRRRNRGRGNSKRKASELALIGAEKSLWEVLARLVRTGCVSYTLCPRLVQLCCVHRCVLPN